MRLAVVGTGLIGTSAALAASRKSGLDPVCGWDDDPSVLEMAGARGAVTPAASLTDAVRDADLAIVAVPVAQLTSVVRSVLDAASAACTVTDVGSTKGTVCAAVGDDPRFVGGHPACGAEARGPGSATADLFEGATWFLTPLPATGPAQYRVAHAFAAGLGARPVAIDPAAHDRLVAVTSHLPHVLANVLLNQAGAARVEGHDPLVTAGGSMRDMSRIAGAEPRVWVDIFLENRAELGAVLSEYRRRVEQVEVSLATRDAGFLARWIGEASRNRRRLLETAYKDAGTLHRLRVHISDRPGVLAGIFQVLGTKRVNISDFELEHVSPERGGTLTILVTGRADAEVAAHLLEEQGYGVLVAPVIDE